MRDKKTFISVILITTVMLFAGGCGKQAEPVSTEPAETVKEVDTEENMESSEVEDNSENEVDTTEGAGEQDSEYEIISIDDTVMYATANCNIMSGAGTQYDKVGSLSYAQEVTINGKVEAGEDKLWYVIKTEDGSTQMVSASMLSETKPAAQTASINGSGSSSNSGYSPEGTGNSETASAPSQNASTPSETAPASSETANSESNGSEQTHKHNWIAHTDQRWVPQIVTVVDEPERYEEYTIFRIYWYNTGTWEETRDPSRFEAWNRDRNGGLYALNITKPEDNPLFLGYNELGQPTYTSDHVSAAGYDFIPAVTHEEDQGYYETYVDYYYCDCGATK